MLKLIIVSFLMVSLVSCKDYSMLMVEKNGVTIKPMGGAIDSAQVLKWKVGSLFKYTVSKGILIKVNLPRLKADDIQVLNMKYGVDSWIIRVSKDFSGRRQTLGEIYLPMQAPALKRVSATSLANFAVYYSAAAPSPRFENFQCPAFDHRKLIGNVDVQNRGITWQNLAVGNFDGGSRDVKLQKFSLDPITLNGGMSLAGSYIIELGVFSEREGVRKAGYIDFPEEIIVSQEQEVAVGGCENSQIPSNDKETLDIRKFKFGR